ncbi:C40 family peptidase [Tenacibaculum finnmarkense genomovar finnmarkense]|uniref:C40 family peptidase n=1 Tax=Tenacibaculum finnmarkense TaxID=2781243 RepID=UPI001E3EA93C|nr:C40 family peptidase [Tenacibaculum finnmarkense]MCD8418094.1 C40 family peptidase [Tenacibaculum finnmarkense genomovar finnmarkense]MCG8185081.1 C40 family peptidase [Tenacibaculum finnmarkense genomovar finnmarkense]MCG8201085.1 C40 family peptidase [Tenacibaculum finnmarkense genomovar finnmarkense]MCG8209040.1 C40 family peptidase [Tenacibaculum finnmarkense genomovar finnmarkense]MCG8211645.1 C40 family peptidase [Tenacibaculum finnmarkense genomovar finnmarkense]
MFFGICNLSSIPMRFEASDASEMVNQVLFGEAFKILEKKDNWTKIELAFDQYQGFIDTKQYQEISQEMYNNLASEEPKNYSGSFVNLVNFKDFDDNFKDKNSQNKQQINIPLGARIPFLKDGEFNINQKKYSYSGEIYDKKQAVAKTALLFLNIPYLWGGKSVFGIDCSGFTQMVYKLAGYNLLRDAKDQVTQGETLNFIEESQAGDLAFFDTSFNISADQKPAKITHVGIILENNTIIHAHGKVRIDTLDHRGIYNVDSKKYTHQLRIIKRFFK